MEVNIIDIVAFDEKTEKVNLIIMDDQMWEDPRDHIDKIQEKVLSYVAFIESGALVKKYPSVAEKAIVIKVVFEHSPCEEGIRFINEVIDILSDTGYVLEYNVF